MGSGPHAKTSLGRNVSTSNRLNVPTSEGMARANGGRSTRQIACTSKEDEIGYYVAKRKTALLVADMAKLEMRRAVSAFVITSY